jgi:starch synthase
LGFVAALRHGNIYKMKVLLAASEAAPIIKLGGLGDVIGSLPKALEKLGVDVDIIVPYYPAANPPASTYKAFELSIPYGSDSHTVEVYKTRLPDSEVDVFLLKNARYFVYGGKEAFADNISETEMFVFFNRAVVEFIKAKFNTYDIVHCNDWHTGLITHLLVDELPDSRPRTLFTIHNLMYQGVGDPDLVKDVGITPGSHRLVDWDLEDGDVNMMLQGITSSDYVNAVSPTYAKEILTKKFGGGFAEILKAREGRLSGLSMV